MYIIHGLTSSSKIRINYIIAETGFAYNEISAIVYIYYIIAEIIAIYAVNKELPAL
jgi:hypothetical protein